MSTLMVALVGDQPMPNVIAALQYEPRVDALYLLHTGDAFHTVARRTKGVLCQYFGFQESQVHLQRVPPFDIERIRRVCRSLVDRAGPNDRVVFNTTGGTKLMSLALSQLASDLAATSQAEIWSLYVESGQRKLIYLEPEDAFPTPVTLHEPKVEHYFAAHGVSIQRDGGGRLLDRTLEAVHLAPYLREAASYLARNAAQNYEALGHLRALVDGQPPLVIKRSSERALLELMHTLGKPPYNVLQLVERANGDLELSVTEFERKFIRGDWLEFYVFHETERQDFDDRRMSVKIEWQDSWRRLDIEEDSEESGAGVPPENELDVVVMQDAQLTICSCKSGKLKGTSARQALYELETIARSVGLYCGKVVAVARPDVSDSFIRRALVLDIAPVSACDLPFIGEIMAHPGSYIEKAKAR